MRFQASVIVAFAAALVAGQQGEIDFAGDVGQRWSREQCDQAC